MIRRCRAQFPGLEFRCWDARDLGGCESSSFDVAWFSFNGIDYAFPRDRVRIIGEVGRVLRPGGSFVFCSHNIRARPWRPRAWPSLVFDRDPRRLIGRNLNVLRKHLVSHYFYRRNRRREVHGNGYAVRMDQAHEYRLLTYHVSLHYQLSQLADSGFGEVEVFGADGTPRGRGDDPTDPWLYYLASKPTAPG
jgi:SAM-dependent methyltransferase